MATPFESALLNLKLFELRREPVLREARDWFNREFNPESFEELAATVTSHRNAWFRMVLGYWDTAASLVTSGAVDRESFLAAHGEVFVAFSKVQPYLAQIRSASGEMDFCKHLAAVVLAAPDAESLLARRRDAAAKAARRQPRPVTFASIGTARSAFTETSQIPKGLGAQHVAEGVLELSPAFEDGLADIEGFSHLYVLWVFDRAKGSSLVAHPPSDSRPHGVFATRSPERPNPIGLTVVELLHREGPRLHVRGIDMLDGTPILDIKPYLSSIPHDQLRRGWVAEAEARRQQA